MDSTRAKQLCEKLSKLVARGPWKDPAASDEALAIVYALKRAEAPHLVSRLAALEEGFTRWFSARRWHTDIEAQRLRDSLLQDIAVVQSHWDRPRTPP